MHRDRTGRHLLFQRLISAQQQLLSGLTSRPAGEVRSTGVLRQTRASAAKRRGFPPAMHLRSAETENRKDAVHLDRIPSIAGYPRKAWV
jgi:hypothetical protein